MTDIIDILKQIEHAQPGGPMPDCLKTVWMRPAEDGWLIAANPETGTVVSLGGTDNWATAMIAIAGAARAEIERLRDELELTKKLP